MPERHNFTETQVLDLRRLGVTNEQVSELRQQKVLWFIAGTAQPVPGTTETRSRLADVAQSARALVKALKRLEHSSGIPNPAEPAANAAAWMLDEAHSDRLSDDWRADPSQSRYPENPDPVALCVEIERLAEIADTAIDHHLKDESGRAKQARKFLADPRPIGRIDKALLDGWCKSHADLLAKDEPMPSYPFGVSAGNKSAFRHIVRVCYEAAGHPTRDPEHAIKSYMAQRRKRQAETYRREGWSEN